MTMTLKRTQDRKTANLSNKAGKQSVIANAFSLPAGREFSCLGATSICTRVCYAGKLERIYKGFRAVVLHNWEAITTGHILTLLDNMIAEFNRECDKRGADKIFRIHADGDFFSIAYAAAWAQIAKAYPDIHFWVYTRSFTEELNVIPTIAGIDNLSVYLSVDSDNAHYAGDIVSRFPAIRIAALADTYADAGLMVADIRGDNKPGAKCPENAKLIPLITENGGACKSCDLCVHDKADVRFALYPKRG